MPLARRHTLLWLLPLLLAAAAITATALVSRESDRLRRVVEKNTSLQQIRAAGLAPVTKPKPAEAERLRHWQEMRADRDFPWRQVFQAVEGADRNTIELLEFRPDKRNRRIVLRGEAQDHDALVAYIQALSEQTALSQVHLLRMQRRTREKIETIEFEIKVSIQL